MRARGLVYSSSPCGEDGNSRRKTQWHKLLLICLTRTLLGFIIHDTCHLQSDALHSFEIVYPVSERLLCRIDISAGGILHVAAMLISGPLTELNSENVRVTKITK